MPPKRGENVSARSPACSAVRQRGLVCGGSSIPLFTTEVVIFQRPGWMPSPAVAGTATRAAPIVNIANTVFTLHLSCLFNVGFEFGTQRFRQLYRLVRLQ